jgi:hypothetical protein
MERVFGNGSTSHIATWKAEPNHRGTYGILMTCLITLGLCLWTAVHLNISSSDDKGSKTVRTVQSILSWIELPPTDKERWTAATKHTVRKIGWMILGFLAPELVSPHAESTPFVWNRLF